MSPLVITAFTTVSALGYGVDAMYRALRERRSGLAPCSFDPRLHTYTGMVEGIEDRPLPAALTEFECRNNRLAMAALQADGFEQAALAARERYGPERIAVILGTSTSGINNTELAYQKRDPATGALPADFNLRATHNLYATTDMVNLHLGLRGPAHMISTACSSSAKVFASAARMMAAGLCDAAIVGGADSLCLNTLYGFGALELVAAEACTPCAEDRAGISIGEGAGFALLEWPERAERHTGLALLGYGESSDGYHMSTPHPDGAGAALAMRAALARADVAPGRIDYINLHGTATSSNDAMEDKAVAGVFGTDTPCSSTKGWTGHTLGAAGITESAIVLLGLQHGFMPGTLNTSRVDPSFGSRVLLDNVEAPVACAMTNSFGFGGSNCSLVFGVLA